jgi:hypothetical protein
MEHRSAGRSGTCLVPSLHYSTTPSLLHRAEITLPFLPLRGQWQISDQPVAPKKQINIVGQPDEEPEQ